MFFSLEPDERSQKLVFKPFLLDPQPTRVTLQFYAPLVGLGKKSTKRLRSGGGIGFQAKYWREKCA